VRDKAQFVGVGLGDSEDWGCIHAR
jgi:hypothetical protein